MLITVKASQAPALRRAVKAARLPERIRTHIRCVTRSRTFALIIGGARTGGSGERGDWESTLMAAIAQQKIKLLLGQL